jgi:hypothetical protein
MKTEIWKPVVGFEGYYEVSNLGNVRSLRNNRGPRIAPRPVKPETTHDGYLRLRLSKSGGKAKAMLHRVVAEAFIGLRPDDFQCCHNDGDKTNNVPGNLRWGTIRSNADDKIKHGSHKGERHGSCTLTKEIAMAIKKEASDSSILARDIADKYKTTIHVVRNIRNGKTWKWLEV